MYKVANCWACLHLHSNPPPTLVYTNVVRSHKEPHEVTDVEKSDLHNLYGDQAGEFGGLLDKVLLQKHVNEPTVLVHFWEQPPLLIAHSLTSAGVITLDTMASCVGNTMPTPKRLR
jgi:hypothetical protein